MHLALRLCGEVALFGFGSGSGEQRLPGAATLCHEHSTPTRRSRAAMRSVAECAERGPPKCAKYYGHACIKMEHYLGRDTAPHDLELEHRWIRALAGKRLLKGYC